VQRQSRTHRGAQRLRADDVAAVDHHGSAFVRRITHRLRQAFGAVVAVGNDAKFHATMIADGTYHAERRRNALLTTDTELSDIAAAAISGDSSTPKNG
jgi:hypothetical protein